MRSLMLVSANADDSVREAVARGERPCPEFLRLEETYGTDLLDWSQLTPRPAGRSIRTSLAHVRAALGRVREYDVVLSDGEHLGIPLALAMARLHIDVPHIVIAHHLDTPAKRRVFRALHPQKRIDRILVHSRNQLPLLHRTLDLPTDQLRLVPYGVDTAFWSPRGRHEDPNLVVSAGREHRDYGTLLDALPPNARLVVADGSPFSPNAHRTNPTQWPANAVRRAFDPVALRDLYEQAAVVVVPVMETSFPAGITTLLEAMAMGKPVIVSGTSGLASVIARDAAVMVPPGDRAALTTALRELLSDPGRREMLGARAEEFSKSLHTLGRFVEELAGHFADLQRRSVAATR
jgi:glycosyltransferase involved in cell wall biosynthesis